MDQSKRRPQFMRSIGRELNDSCNSLIDTIEHFVQSLRQFLQLVIRSRYYESAGKVGNRDPARVVDHSVYGRKCAAADPESADSGQNKEQWSCKQKNVSEPFRGFVEFMQRLS